MSYLKVNVPALTAKAKQVEDSITNIHTAYINIRSIVNKSPKYWQGDASDMHMSMFEDIEERYTNAHKDLCDAPNDMNTIAGNYETVENTIAEELFTLPSDLLQ